MPRLAEHRTSRRRLPGPDAWSDPPTHHPSPASLIQHPPAPPRPRRSAVRTRHRIGAIPGYMTITKPVTLCHMKIPGNAVTADRREWWPHRFGSSACGSGSFKAAPAKAERRARRRVRPRVHPPSASPARDEPTRSLPAGCHGGVARDLQSALAILTDRRQLPGLGQRLLDTISSANDGRETEIHRLQRRANPEQRVRPREGRGGGRLRRQRFLLPGRTTPSLTAVTC